MSTRKGQEDHSRRWESNPGKGRRPPHPVGASPRLLLGEDDPRFRGLLMDELRTSGFVVEAANTGSDLLEALKASMRTEDPQPRYDLVLTDIHIPGNPCVELSRIAPNPALPPIVLFTASSDEETRKNAFCVGAMRLLNRRSDAQYLRQVVGGILS